MDIYKSKIGEKDAYTYLTTSRNEVIDKLRASNVREYEFKPILKRALHKFVKKDIGDFDAKLAYSPMCKLLEDFSMKDFISRSWVYKPRYLKENDFNRLRVVTKVPLYIKDHENQIPIYMFPNNITSQIDKHEKIKSEVQFYTNEDDNIMFGKLMRLKYVPSNEKIVSLLENANGLVDYSLDDESIYDKVMSISFCAIIEGDSKNAIPLYRYDSSKLEHTNVFIGDDYRKEVLGETVKSPHFHFQNEDDSLLCLRKYKKNNNKEHLYKSGRCNAIDCQHLHDYLVDLEELPTSEIERLYSQKHNYGMPFLKMAHDGNVAQCRFLKNIEKYLKNLDPEIRKEVSEVEKWLAKTHGERFDVELNKYVSYDYYPIFGQLIRAIDFIDFVYNYRQKVNDPKLNKCLAEMELLAANDAINTFAGVMNTKELNQNGYSVNERTLLSKEEDCCEK